MIELSYDLVQDEKVRDALQKIEALLNGYAILRGEWAFFDIVIDRAVTNLKYPHNLRFIPQDVIQTRVTGAGTITWNYSGFDETFLDITTTGAVRVRAFIGSATI